MAQGFGWTAKTACMRREMKRSRADGCRVLRIYVVDFVHVHRWPVFNAADVFVALDGALRILQMIRKQDRPEEASQATACRPLWS